VDQEPPLPREQLDLEQDFLANSMTEKPSEVFGVSFRSGGVKIRGVSEPSNRLGARPASGPSERRPSLPPRLRLLLGQLRAAGGRQPQRLANFR
jgi:hypothetical protein